MDKTLKIVVYVLISLFTLTGGSYGAIKIFATNNRVDKLEIRLNAVSVQPLRKQLRELEAKYGHTDCSKMQQPDRDRCYWLKDTIQALTGQPA